MQGSDEGKIKPSGLTAAGSPVLKTLLVSDLITAAELAESLGDERAAQLGQAHDRLARDLLPRHEGHEIDKSEGFLMIFDRPLTAVRYALAYHAAVAELARQEGVELAARVGIHMGEVVLRASSADEVARGAKRSEVEGLAKNMAARLMALGGPRQTLISRGIFDLGQRSAVGVEGLPEGLRWARHGRYALKGMGEPVGVFEVGVAGRAPLQPPADSAKAKRVAEGGWRLKLAAVAALLVLALAGWACGSCGCCENRRRRSIWWFPRPWSRRQRGRTTP